LHNRYKDQVAFLCVYVREAHPTDGWRMPSNDKVGVSVAQPTTQDDRVKVACACCTRLRMTMPLLVDTLDDRVGHAYSGMPDRLYVIDRVGRVAYKAGRGPFGFKTGEMEQSLLMMLLDQEDRKAQAKPAARVPVLEDAAAWKSVFAPSSASGSNCKTKSP
jgi:hypothetical protein